MKRFTVSLLFVIAIVLRASACAFCSPERYYMFCFCESTFQETFERQNDEFWKSYTGMEYSSISTWKEKAEEKGDKAMSDYLEYLDEFLQVSQTRQYEWNYPTAQELAAQKNTLRQIKRAAEQNAKGKYADRWTLLNMRASFLLYNHDEVIKIWESNHESFAKSYITEMMKNLYAGSLLRLGHQNEAWNIYAEQNDLQSLLWSTRKKTNLAGIQETVSNDPKDPVLGILLQTYVNEIQEVLDNYEDYNGDISSLPNEPTIGEAYGSMSNDRMGEIRRFVAFADNVARNDDTGNPCMWESAAALVSYYLKEYDKAQQYIDQALSMSGTPDVQKMARRIKMLIMPAVSDIQSEAFQRYMADELRWLDADIKQTKNYRAANARNRIINLGLSKAYAAKGDIYTAIALTAINDHAPMYYRDGTFEETEANEYDYSSQSFYQMREKMTADQLLKYFQVIKKPKGTLQKYIASQLKSFYSDNYINDVVGTKYLSENKLKEALPYLKKVSQKYRDHQAINYYSAHLSYKADPWSKSSFSVKAPYYDDNGDPIIYPMKENQKVSFCTEVLDLQKKYEKTEGAEKARYAYSLGNYYYMASYRGACWFITHYGWSICDTQNPIEADFPHTALQYMRVAARFGDTTTKTQALFALVGMSPDSWYTSDYDEDWNRISKPNPSSEQYAALEVLSSFLSTNDTPENISRCDTWRQFCKHLSEL